MFTGNTSASPLTKRLYALAQRENGVTTAEARTITGIASNTICAHLRWLCDSGRVKSKAVSEGMTQRRFFADPKMPLAEVEKAIAQRIVAARQAAEAPSRRGHGEGKAKTHNSEFIDSVEYVVIDGRKVKKTNCKAGTDHRFTPSDVNPFFSRMAPGKYPPIESPMARVYR